MLAVIPVETLMTQNNHLWKLLLVCLLLQACSSSNPRTTPVEDRTTAPAPPVISSRQPRVNVPPPAPSNPVNPQVPLDPAPAATPPAIVALLDDAEQAEANGNPDAAAATLERALKIDPKNALLWNRLAGVHMRRGDSQQALTMARRSNTLAAGDYSLQMENWFLILAITTNTGDAQGEAEARKKIEELRQMGAGTSG
ncbi:MAG: hypothetical protein HW386_213 [Gammaproteobacteria bacterium]|nr:hypothetical protein [Gammaproteobacteria bacterium]